VFSPDQVTVRVGSTVTWVNKTAADHTVSSVTRGVFAMRLPGNGQISLQFEAPGTYRYYCAYHPYMLGTVVVVRA
jgi:plastocyanin